MFLNAPEWLLLLLVLGFLRWLIPGWQWWRRPLRLISLALLVFILCDPQGYKFGAGLDLWLLEDHSASNSDLLAQHRAEIEGLLNSSKSSSDRLHIVDFAIGATFRESEDSEIFEGDPNGTRIGNALRFTLAHLAPDRAARFLIVTDGYATEPISDLTQPLLERQIALDYRLLEPPDAEDYQVDFLRTPPSVRPGEPFLIDLQVSGHPDAVVPFVLLCDGSEIGHSDVEVLHGVGNARFTNRLMKPGAHHYQVRILPAHDAIPANNTGESWVQVSSGSRVLLITQYADDPLGKALSQEHVLVDEEQNPDRLDLGRLSGAKAVIINNVPAHQIPSNFLRALDFFVREQGGGLMLVGGKMSYGSGGYFHSSVDDLLPVSMELRKEHRKLQLAMAILMDRSGSMGVSVGHNMTKMDLADDGAAHAIELLSPQDYVSVTAVDTLPHIVVPLTTVGTDVHSIVDPVRHIASEGGGIYCFTALKSGYEQLSKSQSGTRHVILFADANDAVEHGDYVNLVNQMVGDGMTVSTIGMGSSSDKDAGFLEDVAKIGGGRCFFANNPADLPNVFAQETVSVARSTFIKDTTQLQVSADWQEIANHPVSGLAQVDGYNLCYLKPEASQALISQDEYQAPLLAFWQRGLGRAMAVTFPLGGEYSDTVRGWKNYGDFSRTLARWLLGAETPPGIGIRTRLVGSDMEVSLLYDDSWQQQISLHPPTVMVEVQDPGGAPVRHSPNWQKIAPGKFSLHMDMPPNRAISGSIQLPPYTIPFGPLVVGTNPEWTRDPQRLAELKALCAATGGQSRLNLGEIWSAPRAISTSSLRPYILPFLLGLLLLEFLSTRLGLRW